MDDFMQDKVIRLVEDNPDSELPTLRALWQNKLANDIVTVRDGVEALDYPFATSTRFPEGRVRETSW